MNRTLFPAAIVMLTAFGVSQAQDRCSPNGRPAAVRTSAIRLLEGRDGRTHDRRGEFAARESEATEQCPHAALASAADLARCSQSTARWAVIVLLVGLSIPVLNCLLVVAWSFAMDPMKDRQLSRFVPPASESKLMPAPRRRRARSSGNG
jgi:hypothetical protein